MRFFLCCFFCHFFCSVMWGVASAQTFNVGAVLPLSGDAAQTGQVAAAALRASAENLLSAGIDIEVTVLDSESNAFYAEAQAKTLIASGIHALLCCGNAEGTARVVPAATAAGVPVLSLEPVAASGEGIFLLSATEAQVLARLALEPPQPPLGIMAPSGKSGDLANNLLGSMGVGSVRYPATRTPPTRPLTPEALLMATREPGSVVIWDGAAGALRAAEALSARGFAGVRVVRAEVWGELDALSRAELSGAVSALSPAVLGYRLSDTHLSKEKVSSFRRALHGVLFESSDAETIATAAEAWDAAQLLGAAAEQVITYADADLSVAALRSALRDALIGLGPIVGAGGSYDFSGEGESGLLPGSLVLAVWRGGRFFPYP